MFSKIATLWQMISAIAASILFHYQIQEKVARYSEDYAPIVGLAFSILILATLFISVYEFIFFILRTVFPRHSQLLPRRSFFQSNQPIYKVEEGKGEKEIETLRIKRDANAKLLSLCESLSHFLVKHSAIVKQSEVKNKELIHAVTEFKRGILKIYFFGTQSTGKSSLVNTLIGRELSPVGPDKCTSCLVRIKGSNKVRAFAEYEDGTEKDVDINNIEKKIREWAELDNRPKSLVIETNKPILGQPKIELIDSPGTGSARNEVVNRNIESEIVNEAIKSVAIAVIVYLPSGAQMQSHASLLQSFKKNNITTVGVCNLDSNWASLYGRNKHEAERIIREAEANLQEKTKAECFRITLAEDTEEIGEKTVETARAAGANSVQEVRDYLVKNLESREVYLARQTLGKSRSIAKEILLDINRHLEQNSEYIQKLHSQRAELLKKVTEFKGVVNQNPDPNSSVGFISGGAIGLAAGIFALATLPVSAPVIAIATAIGAPTAVGTGIGAVVDKSKDNRMKQDYSVKLGLAYRELKKALESSDLILSSFGPKEHISSLSINEASSASVLEKLYKDADESLSNNERYNTYSTYQSAKEELVTIQNRFIKFEMLNFSSRTD